MAKQTPADWLMQRFECGEPELLDDPLDELALPRLYPLDHTDAPLLRFRITTALAIDRLIAGSITEPHKCILITGVGS